jgi:serine/threonine-protein phosphatase 2A regulatory subunit B
MVQTTELCTFLTLNERYVYARLFCCVGTFSYSLRFTSGLVDKTIKLWKVFEKSLRVVSESNMSDGQQALPPPALRQHLRLPRMQHQDNIIAAVPRKVYSNAHAYHIHSITVNSDQETYISADDLRVNLWNLNISDQSFSQFFSLNACSSLS